MDIQLKIPSPCDPTTETPHKTRGPLNRPSMTQVGRDDFIRELASEPGIHAQMIRAMVRAFLAAALRGRDAYTPAGWRSVVQDMRYVLGSALSEGVEQVRPAGPRKQPSSPVPVKPPGPPRTPVAHDPLLPVIPTPRDDEADLASRQGLPVHLVHALVRAYVAARMKTDEGATPEGRSRILGETRELVWDAILEAVKQVPCPSAPPPRKPARPPRRSQPEWER